MPRYASGSALSRVQQMEQWRGKIQVGNLLTRLQKHAKGEVDMTPTQVKAVEILLRKAVPDLKAIEITGDGGGGLVVKLMHFNSGDEIYDSVGNPVTQ